MVVILNLLGGNEKFGGHSEKRSTLKTLFSSSSNLCFGISFFIFKEYFSERLLEKDKGE